MKQLCGAKRISNLALECTKYQKSLIDAYLASKQSAFKNGTKLILEINNQRPQEHDAFDELTGLDLNDSFNSKFCQPLHFESHHKLKYNDSYLDIVLVENDLTNVEADCILSPICVTKTNPISDLIKIKAGKAYDSKLQRRIVEFVKTRDESKKVG